jgi:hypothetical protein
LTPEGLRVGWRRTGLPRSRFFKFFLIPHFLILYFLNLSISEPDYSISVSYTAFRGGSSGVKGYFTPFSSSAGSKAKLPHPADLDFYSDFLFV